MDRLFHYQRKDRKSAALLILNSVILLIMYLLLKHFDDGSQAYGQLVLVASYGIIAVEIVLLSLAIGLFVRNRKFVIELTHSTLTVSHPSSESWTWQIPTRDILAVSHNIDINGYTNIFVVTQQNQKHHLCQNFNYSRRKLYNGLKQANPTIEIPDNIYRFTHRHKSK